MKKLEYLLPFSLLAIAFTILLVTLSKYTSPQDILVSKLPILSPKPSEFRLSDCPVGGWLNCMPVISAERQPTCQKEFINWAKLNCPDFKGVAY